MVNKKDIEYANYFYTDCINYDVNQKSAEEVVKVVMDLLKPETVIDMGCGTGTWLAEFKKKGCIIKGFDFNTAEEKMFTIDFNKEFQRVDLSAPFEHAEKYDLAISLETGEHIEESKADTFVKNIAGLSDIILFSAAIPGQGGYDHINEQWPSYWIKKFEAQGYKPIDIRQLFLYLKKVMYYSKQTIILLVNQDAPITELGLTKLFCDTDDRGFLDLVHPTTYLWKLSTLNKVKRIVPLWIRKLFRKVL